MRLIAPFLRLVRWQNLLFIIITQVLFYYCIYHPLYPDDTFSYSFLLLVVASVTIAAAGYIINDYSDLNIDRINKPHKNVINVAISRRWAIAWHLMLSAIGIGATVLAMPLQKWYLIVANALCVVLLWLYSTSFKRQLLVGNIIISVLTAWTVLVLFFAEVPFAAAFGVTDPVVTKFFRASFLYAGFAFIISIVREAVKDVEDMKGDARYGCRTLPIVVGVTATKVYASVWIVVLIAALIVLQLYVLQFRWWWAAVYSILFIILPLIHLLRQLYKAKTKQQFGALSSLTKWIMLTGILSMIFFRVYF